MLTRQIWTMFRRWPLWAKVGAWVLAWPLLAAVVIDSHIRVRAGRALAGAVVVVFGLPWFGAIAGITSASNSATLQTSASAPNGAQGDEAFGSGAAADDVAAVDDTSTHRNADRAPTHDDMPIAAVPDGVPTGSQPAMVAKVVDGDTIRVHVIDEHAGANAIPPGETARVRLLEVDAPERNACGANRSTTFVRRTIPRGSTVYLEADSEDTDRYDRYLRYVWLDDGRMLNRQLVRRGVAEAVLYEPNDRHWPKMRAAERKARRNGRGIWGQLCAPDLPALVTPATGEPDEASTPETTAQPAPAPAPAPEAAAAPPPDDGCHPSYSPCVPFAEDVDCLGGEGNGPAYTGRVQVIGPDEYGLDSDGDGIGCEDSSSASPHPRWVSAGAGQVP